MVSIADITFQSDKLRIHVQDLLYLLQRTDVAVAVLLGSAGGIARLLGDISECLLKL